MVNGRGERLWRPLSNPHALQISAFQDTGPRGFGLIQRDRDVDTYQDFESHYERRPSLWVEPVGDWGQGSVTLVEIPSDSEINDNIVAYWSPKDPIPAGSEFSFAYRLSWGNDPAQAAGRRRRRGDAPRPRDAQGRHAGPPLRHRLCDPRPGRRAAEDDAQGGHLGERRNAERRGGRRQSARWRLAGRLQTRSRARRTYRAPLRSVVRRQAPGGDLDVSMDGLTSLPGGAAAPTTEPRPSPGMPQESRVEMPEQKLDRFDAASQRALRRPAPLAIAEMAAHRRPRRRGGDFRLRRRADDGGARRRRPDAARSGGARPLRGEFRLDRHHLHDGDRRLLPDLARPRPRRRPTGPIAGRTAVLMPCYNENPERVFAAIEAMASGIERLGHSQSFDWFVLSDTTDPAVALAEETALHRVARAARAGRARSTIAAAAATSAARPATSPISAGAGAAPTTTS